MITISTNDACIYCGNYGWKLVTSSVWECKNCHKTVERSDYGMDMDVDVYPLEDRDSRIRGRRTRHSKKHVANA